MAKITILGSSNAIAKYDQQNAHILIETPHRKIMVDCGNHPVATLAKAGVEINQITDLVLTHFHADHVGSLPLLIMDMWLEKRSTPLTIYGLPVTLEKVQRLLGLFDWQKWANMYPVNFVAAKDLGASLLIDDKDVKLTVAPVLHLIPTIGVKFEFPDGGSTVYSCDTEPCEELKRLAQGAINLMQEAAGPGKGHTSPQQAGELATSCGVKRLIMIHYDARIGREELLAQARSTFDGQIDLAVDGMVV